LTGDVCNELVAVRIVGIGVCGVIVVFCNDFAFLIPGGREMECVTTGEGEGEGNIGGGITAVVDKGIDIGIVGRAGR